MIPHTQNQPDSDNSESPIFDRLADEMIMFTADEAHDELDITLPADDTTAAQRIFAAVILSVMVTIAIVAVIVGMVLR